MADFTLTDGDIRELHAACEAKILSVKHRLAFDLVAALAPYEKPLRKTYVLTLLHSAWTRAELEIPKTFEATVQKAMDFYCLESDDFKKRKLPDTDALFSWPRGKKAGLWLLLSSNAQAWVTDQQNIIRSKAA